MVKNKFKILVAEDDQFLTKVYQAKLTKEGFEVITAMDGEQALKKIQETKPDLVILDLLMPKKNGFEVLEDLRMSDDLKKTAVLILSNLGQQSDIKKGKDLGALDFLVKSNLSINEVVSAIKETLIKIKK